MFLTSLVGFFFCLIMKSELKNIKKLIVNQSLELDCGKTIKDFPLAYETYGTLNKKKNNLGYQSNPNRDTLIYYLWNYSYRWPMLHPRLTFHEIKPSKNPSTSITTDHPYGSPAPMAIPEVSAVSERVYGQGGTQGTVRAALFAGHVARRFPLGF